MENTRHTRTHTDNVFDFWLHKYPDSGLELKGVHFRTLKIQHDGCPDKLSAWVWSVTISSNPPRHSILKQKLSGRYVECEGCPKESTILICPPKASLFSKSARKNDTVTARDELLSNNKHSTAAEAKKSAEDKRSFSLERQPFLHKHTPTTPHHINKTLSDETNSGWWICQTQDSVLDWIYYPKRTETLRFDPCIFAEQVSGDLSFLYRHHHLDIVSLDMTLARHRHPVAI